jgi:hypothetical protein
VLLPRVKTTDSRDDFTPPHEYHHGVYARKKSDGFGQNKQQVAAIRRGGPPDYCQIRQPRLDWHNQVKIGRGFKVPPYSTYSVRFSSSSRTGQCAGCMQCSGVQPVCQYINSGDDADFIVMESENKIAEAAHENAGTRHRLLCHVGDNRLNNQTD